MISSRIAVEICLAASFCAAQTISINIRGTVKDDADVGISGAVIRLENAGDSTTTGGDGSFTLGGATGTWRAAADRTLAASLVQLRNGRITINVSENAPVAISIHDVAGRQVYSVRRTYGSGTHAIEVPAQPAGILLYRAAIGNEAYSFRSLPIGAFTAERAAGTSGASTLARQAKASDVIADVISVVKEGQLNYRDSIRTSDTSGIVITMIPNAGNVTDTDGNVYQSVRIGNQVWTVENLRTTKYRDGTPIPLVTGGPALDTPAYCFYDNSTDLAEQQKWGALYNWYVVNTGKLAPAGWHVPTDAEWDTLQNYLIAEGYNWDGTTTGNKIGKSVAAKTDWFADTTTGAVGNDPGKNDASGFSGLPAGFRWGSGTFGVQGNYGYWWSVTEGDVSYAYCRRLGYGSQNLYRDAFYERGELSVRVLRD